MTHPRRPFPRNLSRLVARVGVASILLTGGAAAGTSVDAQLLPPEQVFRVTAEASDEEILLHWDVAPGYYLYRDRFRFTGGSVRVRLGDAVLPPGRLEHDRLFGEVRVLRNEFAVTLPYHAADTAPIALTVVSQGCSDIGVCYPPYSQQLSVLRTGAPAMTSAYSLLTGHGAEGFLAADQAFVLHAEIREDGAVVAGWQIAGGYYLYREKVVMRLAPGSGYVIEAVEMPRGITKTDEYFGETEVFYDAAQAVVFLVPPVTGYSPAPVELDVLYQGCADGGLCYPVITRSLVLPAPPAP